MNSNLIIYQKNSSMYFVLMKEMELPTVVHFHSSRYYLKKSRVVIKYATLELNRSLYRIDAQVQQPAHETK